MKNINAAETTERIASALERIEACYGKLQSESSISFSYGKIDETGQQTTDSAPGESHDAANDLESALKAEAACLKAANSRISELESLLGNAAHENARLKAECDELKQAREEEASGDSDLVAELRSKLESMASRRADEVSELDSIMSELESLLAADERNA